MREYVSRTVRELCLVFCTTHNIQLDDVKPVMKNKRSDNITTLSGKRAHVDFFNHEANSNVRDAFGPIVRRQRARVIIYIFIRNVWKRYSSNNIVCSSAYKRSRKKTIFVLFLFLRDVEATGFIKTNEFVRQFFFHSPTSYERPR